MRPSQPDGFERLKAGGGIGQGAGNQQEPDAEGDTDEGAGDGNEEFVPGRSGSRVSRATPPKMKSVMEWMGRPRRLEVTLWPSS
jgi:hypothetical protein